MDNMKFSRYGRVEIDENGTEIIELYSDLESDDDTEQPPLNEPMDLSAQNDFRIKTEMVNDSVHHLDSPAHEYMDGALPPINDQIDVPYPFKRSFMPAATATSAATTSTAPLSLTNPMLQCANVQSEPSNLLDIASTSTPSPAAAALRTMVTSTIVAMTPAHSSKASPVQNRNSSGKSRSTTQSCASQSQAFHSRISQNFTSDLSLDDVFKNTGAQSAQAVAQFIDSKVEQKMQEALNQLKQRFVLVPKRKSDADSKQQKRKRTHDHQQKKLEKNVGSNGHKHGHDLRPHKKQKLTHRSRSPLLVDLPGPSTPTLKHTGKITNIFSLFIQVFTSLPLIEQRLILKTIFFFLV